MMRHRLQHWEQQTLLWFQEHLRRSWLTAAMKIATFLGNGGILWLTACACLLVRQQTRRAALTALLSLVFSALVCNALLKNLVERARPFDKIPGLQFLIRKPHDFSFPSGHTSSSFAVATVFLATLPLWFGLTALGIAAVIAFSRMYLGVHYPSDVLCGMVLGILFGLAALIVLRKNATVKSLDVMVPIMAVCYFVLTVGILVVNFRQLPAVLGRIFAEAFGLRQIAAGGFGAVLMNGVKRGLFSNEAGSGSAPCAAAAAACDDPVKMGFVQALGVLIDTVVICSCTAFLMLLVPQEITAGLTGMDLLQTAMQYHLGSFGVVFIAVTLALFSFSTFIGILFYARSNVAYLFGDRWGWQTAYKVLALVMLMVGGLEAYTVVWDLGDVGIGLMTIFNLIALYPMSGEAIAALRDYERRKHLTQN